MIQSQRGISLIESLLATVVVSLMVFLMANLPNALNLINKSKHTTLATQIALKQIEDKRTINYSSLVNDSVSINDTRLNLLPSASGTVLLEDCDAQICTSGEHVKQITVTVNWKDNNKTQTVAFKTMIGEGGLNQ